MKPEEVRLESRRVAAMTACLILVIVCSVFAAQEFGKLINFTPGPSQNAGEALRNLAIVAAGLAVIAVLEGLVGKSKWSAGIVGVHAALTLANSVLWLYSVLPTIVALLVIILVRMGRLSAKINPSRDEKFLKH